MSLAWAVKIVNILDSFLFVHQTPSTGAEDVKERGTSLHDHREKEHKGKHRDPKNKRRKRTDDPDPQIYRNLDAAQRAAEEERNGE